MPLLRFGVWNAWLLTLFMMLHPFLMTLVDRAVGAGDLSRKMGEAPEQKGEKKSIPVPTLLLVALFIYSIFLPLRLGTVWLYVGLGVYVIGVVMFLTSMITAAKTPLGEVFSRGTYRYSRHPLYISFLFIFIGISLASTSWLFFLLSMGWMVLPLSQVNLEEKGCLESFGSDYEQYMRRTPKWLGMPKKSQAG